MNDKLQQTLLSQIENAKKGESTKDLGQVFTPNHIVDLILDEVGYFGEKIINRKILEPSFGDGAFLIKIIQRLIDTCKASNKTVNKRQLSHRCA